jgi:V/A-type H+-transporting ATPase subunit E
MRAEEGTLLTEKDSAVHISSGVEALIDRLREEGVGRGRAEAEKTVREAETRATWILSQAEEEAEQIRNQAREESDRLRRAGEEALNVAARDALLSLKTQLTQRFTVEVRRLVGMETRKQEVLQQLILEVAGRVKAQAAAARDLELLLPRDVVGFEELSRNPEELEKGILTHFVKLMADELLREGVTLGVARDGRGGIRLRLKEEGVVLDLSDEAVAGVILEHLQPRFRALLEGIVK